MDLICYNIPQQVSVRKYEVDINRLQKCLKDHKTISNKEISEKLNVPITTIEHWFRKDNARGILSGKFQ